MNKSKSVLKDLLPSELRSKTGNILLSEILDVPIIGIYFSAHWCPPCKGFTPTLINFYKIANEEKKQIEIIFASCDEDVDDFNQYYETMPWTAIPYESESIDLMSDAFNINGIPVFLVLDNHAHIIEKDGRNTIQKNKGNGFTKDSVNNIIKEWNSKRK